MKTTRESFKTRHPVISQLLYLAYSFIAGMGIAYFFDESHFILKGFMYFVILFVWISIINYTDKKCHEPKKPLNEEEIERILKKLDE